MLTLTRDDITSLSFSADAPHGTGEYETSHSGKDCDVEGKDLKSHRYHEQHAESR